MKSESVRNAVEAHGWIGIIISVPLFLVFWTGSMTFFYPEVQRWAAMPHFPLEANQERAALNQVVDKKLAELDFDDSRQIFLRLPNEHTPYMRLTIPVHDEKNQDTVVNEANLFDNSDKAKDGTEEQAKQEMPKSTEFKSFIMNPHTGETQAEEEPFQLARFMDVMHFTLHIPGGSYIVGFITLFFLVIVFTGILIQLKKMVKDFFLYRHDRTTRNQMNDMHNIIGVISLPYGLMYAITGLMFNLAILFQVPMMFLVFEGDQEKMLKAIGLAQVEQEAANVSHEMPDINALIKRVEQENNISVLNINLKNYGDENAIMSFSGPVNGEYAQRFTTNYQVKTDDFPKELNPEQGILLYGIGTLFALHEANYAGLDLRFLYFILGIAFCGMIVAGNVLWIAKRQKNNAHPKTLSVLRGITLGGTMGAILATAVAFLFERALPVDLIERHVYVEIPFALVLFAGMIAAFFNKNYIRYIGLISLFTGLVLALIVVLDMVMFSSVLITLASSGFTQPLGVTIGLAFFAGLFIWVSRKLLVNNAQKQMQLEGKIA